MELLSGIFLLEAGQLIVSYVIFAGFRSIPGSLPAQSPFCGRLTRGFLPRLDSLTGGVGVEPETLTRL